MSLTTQGIAWFVISSHFGSAIGVFNCLHCGFNHSILCTNVLTRYYSNRSMKQHSEEQKKALKIAADSLYKAILTLEKPYEVRQFLLDLCTPSEVEAMVDRWWTASLLRQGHSYREISEITGVSVTTIGRVARYMNMGEGGYRLALRREEAAKS
jgi:TrpR-related protein YerC/YecD